MRRFARSKVAYLLLPFLGLAVLGLCAGGPPARAGTADRLCIVPILDGTPTEVDLFQTFRMVDHKAVTLAVDPYYLTYGLQRGGLWTIDEGRRWSRIETPPGAANPLFNQHAVDLTSGHLLVGTQTGLFRLETSLDMVRIEGQSDDQRQAGVAALLEVKRLATTLVATRSGLSRYVAGQPLQAIPGGDVEAIGKISRLFDLPGIGRVAIGTPRGLWLMDDQGELSLLANSDGETIGELIRVHAYADRESLLMVSNTGIFLATMTNTAGDIDSLGYRIRKLIRLDNQTSREKWSWRLFSEAHDAYFLAGKKGLYRITPGEGVVPVTGGGPEQAGQIKRLITVPSQPILFVAAENQLSVLGPDDVLRPVPNGKGPHMKSVLAVANALTPGEYLIGAWDGLYRYRPGGALTLVPTEPIAERGVAWSVVRHPTAPVVVVRMGETVFGLDDAGTPQPIPGSHLLRRPDRFIPIPGRGDILIVARNGLFLIRDPVHAGAGACDGAPIGEPRTPAYCTRAIDAPRRDGNSRGTRVLGEALGRDDVLLLTEGSLLSLAPGSTKALPTQLSNSLALRGVASISELPWRGAVLVRRANGYHLIDTEGHAKPVRLEPGIKENGLHVIAVLHKRRTVLFQNFARQLSFLNADDTIVMVEGLPIAQTIEGAVELAARDLVLVSNGRHLWRLNHDGSLREIEIPGTGRFNRPILKIVAALPSRGTVLLNDRRDQNGLGLMEYDGEAFRQVALPDNQTGVGRVLAYHEQAGGSVLIGSGTGLYRLEGAARLRLLPGGDKAAVGSVRTLDAVPGVEGVLAGTDQGLMQVKPDGRVAALPGAAGVTTGPVRRVATASWWRASFVSAAYGTYVLDGDGRLSWLDDIEGPRARKYAQPHLLQRQKRALIEADGRIFELQPCAG